MSDTWLPIDVERILYVDRGREVILCDRHDYRGTATLLMRMSPEGLAKLRAELAALSDA